MLLTHTSSLDGAPGLEDIANTFDGDPTVTLRDFVAGAAAEPASWSAAEPGTAYSYSNLGASLAGFLVEAISGESLETYSQKHIFQPLGMSETSWFAKGLDPSHIAMPYEFVDGAFQPQGNYGVPFYPATELRTSVNQLARFLIMFEEHGELDGARILHPETVDEMRRPQIPNLDPDQGIIWHYDSGMGTKVFGHTGGYFGVTTDMEFDPATGAGYVVLMNGGEMSTGFSDEEIVSAVTAVSAKLLALAEALP
jgi:CubicO group peptidase (beta-lactamase class C family)